MPCCTACSSLFDPGNLILLVNSTAAPSLFSFFSISAFILVFKCCSFSIIPCIWCRCPSTGGMGLHGWPLWREAGLPRAQHRQFQTVPTNPPQGIVEPLSHGCRGSENTYLRKSKLCCTAAERGVRKICEKQPYRDQGERRRRERGCSKRQSLLCNP